MSRWFRHYAGMMRDDKLVRAAVKCGQTIERVVWVYGAMLESAAELNDDGRYDFDAAEVAYFLRADEADISAIEASLAACGRIDGGRVVHWCDRQFKSDSSAERVKRHRNRKASDGNGVEERGRNVTDRYWNDDVTLHRRSSNAPETETETETEKKEDNPPSQARGGVVVLHPEETENEIPAVLDRRAYPDKFEAVWDEYKPIASKNATKADAFRAWQKLSASDQQSCYAGVVEYAMWLQDERKRRPDTPAKHLATFINKRGWEPFEEADHATG